MFYIGEYRPFLSATPNLKSSESNKFCILHFISRRAKYSPLVFASTATADFITLINMCHDLFYRVKRRACYPIADCCNTRYI